MKLKRNSKISKEKGLLFMNIFQALILGAVQALTEFLPISSSAHLQIIPQLLNWTNIPESYDIALHFGTLLAIGIFFCKDWINLIKAGINNLFGKVTKTRQVILVHSVSDITRWCNRVYSR